MTALQPCAAPAVLGSDLADEQAESPTCAGGSEILYGPYKACAGEGWSVRIRQSKRGFRSQALIDCVLPIAPDQAYDLLTDPEVKEWRQVKECTYRRVWEDDGNRQLVEVEQTSTVFFKTIHTRMHVTQDRRAGTMRFSLAKPGMLRMCAGQWTVSAVPGEGGCAKVHLEQEMQPAFAPPPPFKRFLRRAMLAKAAGMLQQMLEEAARIREGCAAAAAAKLSGARSLGAIELTASAVGPVHIRPEPDEEGHRGYPSPDLDPRIASHQLEFDSESEC